MFKIQKFYKKICTLFVVFCVAGQLWAQEEADKQNSTENLAFKAATAKSKFLALLHGFAPATLVKTPSGYSEIGALKVGDPVICVDNAGQITQSKVTATRRFIATKTICLSVGQEIIITNLSQPFFCHGIAKLVNIEALSLSSKLQSLRATTPEIQSLWAQQLATELVAISVELHQNYCVTNADIVVHNLAPVIAAPIVGKIATWICGGIVAWGVQKVVSNYNTARDKKCRGEEPVTQSQEATNSSPEFPTFNVKPLDINNKRFNAPTSIGEHIVTALTKAACSYIFYKICEPRSSQSSAKQLEPQPAVPQTVAPPIYIPPKPKKIESRQRINVFNKTTSSEAKSSQDIFVSRPKSNLLLKVLPPKTIDDELAIFDVQARTIPELIQHEEIGKLLAGKVERTNYYAEYVELAMDDPLSIEMPKVNIRSDEIYRVKADIPELDIYKNSYLFLKNSYATDEQIFRIVHCEYLFRILFALKLVPDCIVLEDVCDRPNSDRISILKLQAPGVVPQYLKSRYAKILEKLKSQQNITPEITPPTKPTGCGDIATTDEAGQIGCALVPEETPDLAGNTGCGSTETPSRPEHIGCALVPAKNPDLDRIPGCGPVEDFKLDDTVLAKSKHGDRPRNARPQRNSVEPFHDQSPKAHNIKELIESTPLGKILKGKYRKIIGVVAAIDRGVPVYEITEKIPELGLKKGDVFYIDHESSREIEVFVGYEQGDLHKAVIRTDGTINHEKTSRAKEQGRWFRRKGG